MRDTIDQFMWGFQQSFRRGLEDAVDKVFDELGQPCSSMGYLIGLLERGGDRHPLCIEPEDGPLLPADFEGLHARAEEFYLTDPESSVHHSHPRVHERRHRMAWERAFGNAIKEIIEAKHDGGLTCYVGLPTVVEQHLVYPVVAIPTDVAESLPALTREFGQDPRWKVDRSIALAAISEVLLQARRALHLPDAGEGAEIGTDVGDLLRAAVSRFSRATVVLSGNEMTEALSDAMNRLSTMRYEQRIGAGRLILVQRDTVGIEIDLTFHQPIPIRETRTLRKLLELSGGKGPALLTDGDDVYALGRLTVSYDPASERAFELLVLDDGIWELRHNESALMTVRYGIPELPRDPLSKERFAEVVLRIFDADGGADVDVLWDIAVGAAEAEHGTMIVISASASDEAERLSSQAIPVQGNLLRPEVLHNITQIDGAVLVDQQGVCHALGVILDGMAAGGGDRGRGARFNSAVKYMASAPGSTVIVIVSEDGMINLLPDLPAQLSRAALDNVLADLRSAAAIEPVHPERFYKAFNRVKACRFYLSQEHCDEVNQLHVEHWDRRRAAGAQLWITPEPLVPDDDMNEAFLVD